MKKLPLLLLALILSAAAQAQTTTKLGDWAEVTAPTTYRTGESFDIEVDILKVEQPTQLVISANWIKADGNFGGFLQMLLRERDVTEPDTQTYHLKITKTQPNMGQASLTFYFSPDGTWQKRTQSGVVKMTPLAEGEANTTTPRVAVSVQSKTVAAPVNRTGRNPFSQFATFPQEADFFPIGVWLQNPKYATQYQDLGMNFYYGLWDGPTAKQIAALKQHDMGVICKYNDYAAEHLIDSPTVWAWMHADEPDLAIAYPRKTLKAPGGKQIIKEHWPEVYEELDLDNNEYDGWGLGYHPINDIQPAYRRMKADNPDRPVFIQLSKAVSSNGKENGRGDRSGKTWEYPLFIEGSDAVSYDNYPVAYGDSDKLWLIPKGVDQLYAWGAGDRPVMVVLEAGFGETWANKHQQRAQLWMAINHGASAICWFAHRWANTEYGKQPVTDKMPIDNKEVGQAVKELNGEVIALASVINSPAVIDIVTAEGVELDLGARYKDGFLYVFAVERAGTGGKATIKVKGLDAASVTVINEDRTLAAKGGTFTDTFDAWSTHLYKIPMAKAPSVR